MSTHYCSSQRTESSPSDAAACSALDDSWKSINPILRCAMDYGDFKSGWQAAMKSIWERLPMPAYGSDPMTPREVEKLLDYVKFNLPNDTRKP